MISRGGIRSRDEYILLLEERIGIKLKRKKKKERKKGREEQYTYCFVATGDWTIKLQGEISSDCPERNLVTAAGP